MVYALVYASTALQPWTRTELVDLLNRSRTNNASLDITGILLHQDGTFLQLLEGPTEPVQTLYRKIERDPRHHHVEPIWVSNSAQRRFFDWSMGFRDLDDEPIDHPGFNNILRLQVDAVEQLRDPAQLTHLLRILEPAW